MQHAPLSHHQIFELVEPFTRSGRQVDLAASDRLARRLMFKPVEHVQAGARVAVETLELENPEPGVFHLTRRVTRRLDHALAPDLALTRDMSGVTASLLAEGDNPARLLADIDAIAWQKQFAAVDGHLLGWTLRLSPPSTGVGAAPAAVNDRLQLQAAEARVAGLTLTVRVPRVRGMPAELTLQAEAGDEIQLPEDLLAVLGWHWSRLSWRRQAWRATLKLGRREPERSRDAQARLVSAVQHLARTLAEPPRCFHQRQRRARWGVAFRRSIPLLVCLGLIGAALAVPMTGLQDNSAFRLLIFNAPPLLMVMFFSFREMPRIELPRFPRPNPAPAWRLVPAKSED